MKSEHRHELETNQLALSLKRLVDKTRPYQSTMLTVLAVGLGLYALTSMWRSYGSARDEAAWDDYEMAVLEGDVEMKQLQQVASGEDHGGAKMQEWAHAAWADRQLRIAANGYLADRENANKRLTDIAGVYGVLASSAADPEIRNRARLGLARVKEMQDKIDDALSEYAKVEGALGDIAAERIKALESKQAKEACKWLATAPLPKLAPASGPGMPGVRPGFQASPPAADDGDADAEAAAALEKLIGGLEVDAANPRYADGANEAAPASGEQTETEAAPVDAPGAESTEAGASDAEAAERAPAAAESSSPSE